MWCGVVWYGVVRCGVGDCDCGGGGNVGDGDSGGTDDRGQATTSTAQQPWQPPPSTQATLAACTEAFCAQELPVATDRWLSKPFVLVGQVVVLFAFCHFLPLLHRYYHDCRHHHQHHH